MFFQRSPAEDNIARPPFWTEGIYLRHNISAIYSQPFTPFVILSADDDEVFYYTQSFAQIANIHPSTSIITNKFLFSLRQEIHSIPLGQCSLFYSSPPFPHPITQKNQSWIDELLYELRTGSLLMDLSSHVMKNMEQIDQRVVDRFTRAAFRQKVSTILTTDLIQLLFNPPMFQPISLLKVLKHTLKYLQNSSNTQFNIVSASKYNQDSFNPGIFTSSIFPENVLLSVLLWLQGIPITLELELMNPFSVGISISVEDQFLLSTIQGFSLIAKYLRFFASYFNCRSWVTQNSINIIFPLVFS